MNKIDPIDRAVLVEKLLKEIKESVSDQALPPLERAVQCDLNRYAVKRISEAPTLDVQPVRRGEWEQVMTVDIAVTHTELKHLINDIIAYTWKLEDRGIADEAHGYNSRKALLAKLQEIERENFPENSVVGG